MWDPEPLLSGLEVSSNDFCCQHCSRELGEWCIFLGHYLVDISTDYRGFWCGKDGFNCFNDLPKGQAARYWSARGGDETSIEAIDVNGQVNRACARLEGFEPLVPSFLSMRGRLRISSEKGRYSFIGFNLFSFLLRVGSNANLK